MYINEFASFPRYFNLLSLFLSLNPIRFGSSSLFIFVLIRDNSMYFFFNLGKYLVFKEKESETVS